MEYTRRRHVTVEQESDSLQKTYSHDLQLYRNPPSGQISLVEFQELALERLKVLHTVETVALKRNVQSMEEQRAALISEIRKEDLHHYVKLFGASGCASHTDSDIQARKKDHLSHFILRLACCGETSLQNWFVNQEVELFRLRFSALNKEGVAKFLACNNFEFSPISSENKSNIRDLLSESTPSVKALDIDNTDFYKVPFERAAELVGNRKVYLSAGFAYVPTNEIIHLCCADYKLSLCRAMEFAKDYLPKSIAADVRLHSFLKSLPTCFSGMTRVVWNTETTPISSLNELAKTSYPLCMRVLHDALRTNHHLKFGGRMQYGLFIKGIGVSLSDALQFWQEEFTKKMDPETFAKRYSYHIRHSYGKEGNHVNYTPYGCIKIINQHAAAGEFHGCPYKLMSPDVLKQTLTNYGLPMAGVHEIVETAKSGDYLMACTKYFEVKHKKPPTKPFVHPNAYFSESRQILAKSDDAVYNNDAPKSHAKPPKVLDTKEKPQQARGDEIMDNEEWEKYLDVLDEEMPTTESQTSSDTA